MACPFTSFNLSDRRAWLQDLIGLIGIARHHFVALRASERHLDGIMRIEEELLSVVGVCGVFRGVAKQELHVLTALRTRHSQNPSRGNIKTRGLFLFFLENEQQQEDIDDHERSDEPVPENGALSV
jgi:hypothetical protein